MRASSALRFRLFLGGWKKRLARLATMGAVGVLVRDGVLLLGGELRADEDGRETSEPAGEEERLVVAGCDDEHRSWESARTATRDATCALCLTAAASVASRSSSGSRAHSQLAMVSSSDRFLAARSAVSVVLSSFANSPGGGTLRATP
mgnify:CR=1 FL=1